jgi:integrase
MAASVSDLLDIKDVLPTTLSSYRRLLAPIAHVTLDDRECIDAFLRAVTNVNTRRATAIALRGIGYDCKIPKGVPRRYDLPDEESLRIMFTYSKYEVQFLSMMYLGLRIGEAAYVNRSQLVAAGQIVIDLQVAEWQENGKWLHEVRHPKSFSAAIDVPLWLAERLPDHYEGHIPYRLRAGLHYTSKKYLGRPVNAHALRHWYATTMIARGVPLPIVQRQMRHSDIAVTLRTYAQFEKTRMSLFD